jgi:hypothetical protein
LLQDGGWRTRCHTGGNRRPAVLAAEEIAPHCVTGIALGIVTQFAERLIIRLSVLHRGQFQVLKILDYIQRLLLRSRSRHK